MRDRVFVDLATFDDLDAEAIKELRGILENEHDRPFSLDEAKEVGIGLLKLFEVLADDEQTEQDDTKEEQKERASEQLVLI